LAAVIRRALEKSGIRDVEETHGVADQAIGLALDMDQGLASRLSPESLVSLMELGSLDDRVIELVAQAIELELVTLQADGDMASAELRRSQAGAVHALLARRAGVADGG
jgi:hypothetical protein